MQKQFSVCENHTSILKKNSYMKGKFKTSAPYENAVPQNEEQSLPHMQSYISCMLTPLYGLKKHSR